MRVSRILIAFLSCMYPMTPEPQPSGRGIVLDGHAAADILARESEVLFGPSAKEALEWSQRSTMLQPTLFGADSSGARTVEDLLASFHRPAEKEAARQRFVDALRLYPQLMGKLKQRPNDLGAAAAALTAAAYMAYRDVETADADFPGLVRQMDGSFSEQVRRADDETERASAEHLAALAVGLASYRYEVKRHPTAEDVSAVQHAGGVYLQAFLRVPADSVALNHSGIAFEPTPAVAPTNQPSSQTPAITRIIFTLLPRIGLGGVTYTPEPVLLFSDGVACRCLNEDLAQLDLKEFRTRRPNAIGEWRGTGQQLELKWGTLWRHVAFSKAEAVPLGDGWRGNGVYETLSGSGAAGPGAFTVASSRQLLLNQDGSFALNTTAGANGPGASSSAHASYKGRYEVQGWIMTLRFDDGSVRRYTALRSSTEPDGAIWLAGEAYVLR